MIDTPYIPFDTVFVVGGTHGNERTGVTLVQHWLLNPAEVQRQTFTTELLLGNPEAIQKNVRFIDRDLNRSFLSQYINGKTAETHESARAREIVANLQSGHTGKRTFAIDLHTTTAHMGITLITNTDPVNLAIAADVQKRLPGARIYCFADSDRINSCLRAAADGGIGVEIGPIPQGVVRHDILEITAGVVQEILDTLEAFNEGNYAPPDPDLPVYLHDRQMLYPITPAETAPFFIHQALEGRDYQPLAPGQPIFQDLNGQVICYEGGDTGYPVFINEAAYYYENIAFSLTRKMPLESLLATG
ncbi:MAG: aspartoacylase [Desulfobacteraceae bacterium]|nr:aspartoacylase [Desulfobacteraceae bacterium]MBC2751267.1 aspartoacylase [Desulfobacteraceae bacterium]